MMKLITFDFWNTLFMDRDENVRNGKRIGYAFEILRKYAPELDSTAVERAFDTAAKAFDRQWQDLRASSMDEYVRTLLDALHMQISSDDEQSMTRFFETILLEHKPVIIEQAAEAVRFARSRMLVGLISDTGYSPGRTLRRILGHHGLEECFHSYSFSNETGYLKPKPETFWRILSELDIRPEEAVHIGDLEHTDIAGAKQIGMKAIKYIGSNREAVRDSIADVVIDRLSDLAAALEQLP